MVSKVATGISRAAIMGARSLIAKATAEAAAEAFVARKAGWRFVSSALIGGDLGRTNLRTGEVFIADNLVGDALMETVRHEFVHQAMTPKNGIRVTARIIGYKYSDTLRFAEEFAAEFYGTGSVTRAWQLASQYKISITRVAGEVGAYVATVSAASYGTYIASHGLSPDVMEWLYGLD
jgi:hypothetical protein